MARLTPLCALLAGAAAMGCGGSSSAPTSPGPGGGGPGPSPSLIASVPIPENYGIHDTYVRDGVVFVFAWNSGVMIYDIGGAGRGGTPANPVLVSSFVTSGGEVHNGWWFHNPVSGQNRYLFIGQEGPGIVGSSSSGDIHVVDVSDLAAPVEVAFFHLGDVGGKSTGTHNFWLDEQAQLLYAAYYNGGVVALDVSGTLSGDLAAQGRLLANVQPGGPGNTYVWGVQQAEGAVYALDMLSGLWKLSSGTLAPLGGGNNVPERFSSDLWVQNGYAYTGTWGTRGTVPGNAVKIWSVGVGSPVLVDSIITPGIGTVSDVQVSPSGTLLMFSTEHGINQGIWFYRLTDPARPILISSYLVSSQSLGVHTATLAPYNGRLYLFAARDPSGAALLVFDVTALDQ